MCWRSDKQSSRLVFPFHARCFAAVSPYILCARYKSPQKKSEFAFVFFRLLSFSFEQLAHGVVFAERPRRPNLEAQSAGTAPELPKMAFLIPPG